MDGLRHDLHSAIRSLIKARGFTAVALLVFSLGIGINIALYSVVSALFLRPLPVSSPEELVYIYMFQRNSLPIVDDAAFRALKLHDRIFAGLTAHSRSARQITVNEETETRLGESVLANYFDVLGARPMLGRTFLPGEDAESSGEGTIVISHRLWTRTFKGDERVLGRQLDLCCFYPAVTPGATASSASSRRRFTVVGVMGPGFHGVSDPWTPSDFWTTADLKNAWVIGRRQPHVTLPQVEQTVRIQGDQLIAELKKGARGSFLEALKERRYEALPANGVKTPYDPKAILVPARLATALTVIVGVVLLIAATNIAGLLMARAVTRAGETAVRRVLGASIWRVTRQLVIEGLLLSILGGALALPVAKWLLDLLRAATPASFSIDATLNLRVLVFALAASIGAGVLTGLAPVPQVARLNLLNVLTGTGTGATTRTRVRLRHGILIPQVGLSLVLLVAAGLQLKALTTLEMADRGYDADDVVVVTAGLLADPGEQSAEGTLGEIRARRSRTFYQRLRARLEGIPGAAAVAVSATLPIRALASTEYDPGHDAVTQEAALAGGHGTVGTLQATVGPGYFRTMGMRILKGRDFDERDQRETPAVVIVSETLADRLWPGGNPLGRMMALENRFPAAGEKLLWLEVIGVAHDIDPVLRDRRDAPIAYLAMGQQWQPSPSDVMARVPGSKPAAVAAMRQAVLGADPFATVLSTRTVDQIVAEILYPRRMAAAILVAAGLVGILLASIGLYGVMAYSVARRVQEIGVRRALGADHADILRLVLGEGARVACVGFALGGVLAYWGWRFSVTRVAEIPPLDVTTLVAAPVVLAVVIFLACYVPARRAAKGDPLASLRAF